MKAADFMARAIELAKKGRYKTQPNPMVGCVLVKDGQIIGEGWHQEYGKDHAEINAIKNCKKKFGAKNAYELIAGSDVYVNLEPCSIQNNTPPCSHALIKYRIKNLFCGTLDPNPKINGRGVKLLKESGINIKVGLLKKECKELNRIFFVNQKQLRPYIILKSAQSIDGKIALKNGESNWIYNSESRKDSHLIRSRVRSIMVGRTTIEVDNPSLTIRLDKSELGLKKNESIDQPAKIILGNLQINEKKQKIFSSKSRIIIGSRHSVKQLKTIQHLKYKKREFLEEFIQDLLKMDISSILVEGGPKTLNAFLANDLFDELVLYTAPSFLGKGSKETFNLKAPERIKISKKLKMVKIERFQDDIKTTYYNRKM